MLKYNILVANNLWSMIKKQYENHEVCRHYINLIY